MKRRKRIRRRIRLAKRIITVILFIAAIGIGAEAGKTQAELMQAVNMDKQNVLANIEVDAKAVYQKDVINILLIGIDKREDQNDTGRSDSTMIATIDLKHNQLKLTSLMRDMYVDIPGHGKNKFNSAYAFGGVSLLYQTIAQDFNLKLDNYIIVDFKAFKDVIDGLDGVEITLTEQEAHYLNTAYHGKLNVSIGRQILTGKEALAYCRIRQDVRGDFGRTQRQRTVLNSIFNSVKDSSYGEIKKTAINVLSNVTTDLTEKQIMGLLQSALKVSQNDFAQFRLPLDNSYYDERVPGVGLVLVPDLPMNIAALHEFIFESGNQPADSSTGTDVSNQ